MSLGSPGSSFGRPWDDDGRLRRLAGGLSTATLQSKAPASMRAYSLALLFAGLLTACSAPPSQSAAQAVQGALSLPEPTRQAPASMDQVKLSFAPVVKRAAPAVVNVSSKRVVRQQVDPFWEMFGGGIPRPGGRLAGLGRDRARRRGDRDQQPCDRGRPGDHGRPGGPARIPGQGAAGRPPRRPRGAQDRGRRACRPWPSTTGDDRRSATWCWPSAIRSASARR